MHRRYEKKANILLWMKHSRKRPRAEVSNSPAGPGRKANHSSYDTQAQRMGEIDEICDEPVKKHGEMYTQRSRLGHGLYSFKWANMIPTSIFHSK